MRNICKRSISMISLCFIMTSFAYAYKLTNWKLEDDMKYVPYSGFSETSIAQFNEALYTWNKELPNGPKMTRSTTTHNSSPEFIPEDGKNYIYRLPEFDINSEYVAINRVVTEGFGILAPKKVVESDINFNVNYKFANSGQPGCYDVQSVFLHEAGHTLGLDDIKSPGNAVMYFKATTGKEKRQLSEDDINALKDRYNLK